MERILLYTFFTYNQITNKLARSITAGNLDTYYIGSLNALIKKILENKYSYVLGLGNFRKGSKKIRIERIFGNKYGKNKIIEDGREQYFSTWEIAETENIVYSDKSTTGPCNKSAYLLSREICENNLKTKLAFVHIPKDFDFEKAKGIIDCLVSKALA